MVYNYWAIKIDDLGVPSEARLLPDLDGFEELLDPQVFRRTLQQHIESHQQLRVVVEGMGQVLAQPEGKPLVLMLLLLLLLLLLLSLLLL